MMAVCTLASKVFWLTTHAFPMPSLNFSDPGLPQDEFCLAGQKQKCCPYLEKLYLASSECAQVTPCPGCCRGTSLYRGMKVMIIIIHAHYMLSSLRRPTFICPVLSIEEAWRFGPKFWSGQRVCVECIRVNYDCSWGDGAVSGVRWTLCDAGFWNHRTISRQRCKPHIDFQRLCVNANTHSSYTLVELSKHYWRFFLYSLLTAAWYSSDKGIFILSFWVWALASPKHAVRSEVEIQCRKRTCYPPMCADRDPGPSHRLFIRGCCWRDIHKGGACVSWTFSDLTCKNALFKVLSLSFAICNRTFDAVWRLRMEKKVISAGQH